MEQVKTFFHYKDLSLTMAVKVYFQYYLRSRPGSREDQDERVHLPVRRGALGYHHASTEGSGHFSFFIHTFFVVYAVLYSFIIQSLFVTYVHPSIFVRLSGAGSRWQSAKQGPPGFLLPSHALQFLLGDPEGFPGQKRYIIPPVGPGSAPGSPPS